MTCVIPLRDNVGKQPRVSLAEGEAGDICSGWAASAQRGQEGASCGEASLRGVEYDRFEFLEDQGEQ